MISVNEPDDFYPLKIKTNFHTSRKVPTKKNQGQEGEVIKINPFFDKSHFNTLIKFRIL